MKAATINFKYKNWEYFQHNHYPELLPDRFPSGLFKDCYVSSKFEWEFWLTESITFPEKKKKIQKTS